jgi:hypothetical protein
MQLEDESRDHAAPGQAVFNGDDSVIIGFVYKFDYESNVVDVIYFEPWGYELLPNHTFVAAFVPDAEKIFADVLEHAVEDVKTWWKKAVTDPHTTFTD